MRLSISQTESAHTAAISFITIAALAVLGLVGSYWTLQWLAPRPEPHAQAPTETYGQVASALQLFGTAPRETTTPVATGVALRLLGLVAATEGRDAYAVVVLDGRQIIATRAGEDIAPGVKLEEVATDHVILDRNGVRETLAWPEKAPAPENTAQRATNNR